MKQYIITVNGTSYEVAVQELSGSTVATPVAAPAPAAAPKAAPASTAAPKAAPAPAVDNTPVEGTTVAAPMPGTILDIKVNVGDKVESGTVLCILEAMKMENDIVAPEAGTVKKISTSKGASVNSGDVLVVIG